MRNIFFCIAILSSIFFFFSVETVKAVCVCTDWDCLWNGCGTPDYPLGCSQTCTCVGCVESTTCGGGYYVCNTGCCPIGTEPTPVWPPTPIGDPGGADSDEPDPSSGGVGCTVTAPTNLTSTSTSPTSIVLHWTPGANGVYQALWVSTDPDPQAGCAGSLGGTSVCPVRMDSTTSPLPSSTSSYAINGLLTPETVYYWRVMNLQTSACYASAHSTIISSCSLLLSSSTIPQGQSRTITSSVSTDIGIDNVAFSSGSPTYLSVNPSSDITYPFQTSATGLLPGSAVVTSNAYIVGGALGCTANATITVLPPLPWWQVKDSDVQSAGDLISGVPGVSTLFNLDGPGGFPGVSAYGGTTNLTGANVSSTGWLVNGLPIGQRTYDYAFLANQIPDDILAIINSVDTADVAGSLTSGDATHDDNDYYWYKYDGELNGDQALTIPAVDFGTRKVILMVDNADANIAGNINLTDGVGFFMLIVNGNINIDATIGGGGTPNLEGLYLADGAFSDGLGNTQLWVRGSVSGNLGINMQRDLGGMANTDPAEFFEYAPDQIMLYPSELSVRKINWKEVAP